VVLVLALAAIVFGGVMLVPAAYARLDGDTGTLGIGADPAPTPPAPTAPPPPTLAAAPVSINLGKGNFFSWALLDRETGAISGSANKTATNSTESMVKVWIVSDYLRRLGDKAPSASRLKQASVAIRRSDDKAAQSLYNASGGSAVLSRMTTMCGLKETKPVVPPGEKSAWWSYTKMSPADAVRMGECVKNGKAAGPKWTKWVLTEMTKVNGTTAKRDQPYGGRWGIIDGLPPQIIKQGVGIKNGWTPIFVDNKWHVNCLAVADNWVLAVMMRYPIKKGLDFGASVCASVAEQLVAPQPGAALKVPQLSGGKHGIGWPSPKPPAEG